MHCIFIRRETCKHFKKYILTTKQILFISNIHNCSFLKIKKKIVPNTLQELILHVMFMETIQFMEECSKNKYGFVDGSIPKHVGSDAHSLWLHNNNIVGS